MCGVDPQQTAYAHLLRRGSCRSGTRGSGGYTSPGRFGSASTAAAAAAASLALVLVLHDTHLYRPSSRFKDRTVAVVGKIQDCVRHLARFGRLLLSPAPTARLVGHVMCKATERWELLKCGSPQFVIGPPASQARSTRASTKRGSGLPSDGPLASSLLRGAGLYCLLSIIL